MKKLVTILLAIVLVGGAIFLVQSRRTTESSGIEGDLRRARVERGELVVSVSATGSIVPRAEAQLTFDLPGKVKEVWVEEGDVVKEGTELARLDDTNLKLSVRQAQAALDSAQAQLDQLQADPRPAEVAASQANREAAHAAVASAIAQRDQVLAGATWAEIVSAQAQVASATAQHKIARDTHDKTIECRTVTLPNGEKEEICPGLGTVEEQARYNLFAAEQALEAAQVQLDQLRAGPTEEQVAIATANISNTLAQRDAAQAQLDLLLEGPSVYQVAAAQASVEQAQVALEMAQAELEKATVVAPWEGVVTAVNVQEGEVAPATLPAVVLVDVSELQITVDVDEIDVAQIVEGQRVEISVDALPDEVIFGTVERIAPAATQVGGVVVYQVTIVLDETDLPLRVGMSATASITVERLTDVLLVPNWAIRIDRETGQTLVNLLRGESLQEVAVDIGVRGQDVSEVLSGLREGDVVVAGEVGGLRTLLGGGE